MKITSPKIIIIIITLILSAGFTYSQSIKGTVYFTAEKKTEPLEDAVVKWLGTTKGTITDKNGKYELSLTGITDKRLIISYSGFKSDTINAEGKDFVETNLVPNTSTSTIDVVDRKRSTHFGNLNAKTEIITSQELVKDACCDLAGCFGRNSSVEVAVTDIITDSKELKILGLEGAYTQLLIDNMPLMNGLNVKYGISSIPGTMIDKITISKGSNSVLQGYESISGIMNVIIKDRNNSEKLLVNGFLNSMLEKQFNLNFANNLGSKWSNILSLHTVQKSNVTDENGDGFLDNPLTTRYMLYNKWNFSDNTKKTEFNIAGRYWNEKRIGGQRDDIHTANSVNGRRSYEQSVKINSLEGYSRFGRQFSDTRGMRLYLTSSYYDQKAVYGITDYDAVQTNFSAMGFYEFEVFEKSFLKTGLSFKYLNIDESIRFNDSTNKTYAGDYLKKESIAGAFAENSISFLNNNASLMTGIRFDYHNEDKLIITPRALFRYQPSKVIVFRASIGTGFRTVNLFSEYSSILASSRDIITAEKPEPEKTLNYGADVILYFAGEYFGGNLNVDFYRTDFSNKIIPDYETDPKKVIFANMKGKAYSNVLQAELNLTVLSNIDLKFAYKYIDLKYESAGVMKSQPFIPKHRILTTVSYSPISKSWGISAGLNWFGKQKLPSTLSNPVEFRLPEESIPYTLINAQINKNFRNFEIYAGVENLLDFRQENPILSADDPFGPYFDTSFIWGPTKGRELYAGFRFLLK